MKNIYIKVNAIQRKLKNAENQKQTLYIQGPVGIGKTAALNWYYKNKPVLWLSGIDKTLSAMPPISKISESNIVIDDITWLTDQASKEYVITLAACKNKHVVMAGRGRLPDWLQKTFLQNAFLTADVTDFQLDEEQIIRLLQACGIEIPKEQIEEIHHDTEGHALFLLMIAYQLCNQEKGGNYGEVVREAAELDCYRYYNKELYDRWSNQLRSLLSDMVYFPSFHIDMAKEITEDIHIERTLQKGMEVGNFLTMHEDGMWEMRPRLQKYLIWHQHVYGDSNRKLTNFGKAGHYFKKQGNVKEALKYYQMAGMTDRVKELLIENARNHPGTGHYYETKEYYFKLPQEQIEQSPVLMAGMSMLCSLLMRPKDSEVWYGRLEQYLQGNTLTAEEEKEARQRLAYLDIALPHRGTTNLVKIIKNTVVLMQSHDMVMPEFSVTSNLPSIMNGGKDFCKWSKSDRTLAAMLNVPIRMVLGKWGEGLIDIALAESLYEKGGGSDLYEIMTLLNSGYTKADAGGKIEMCFVATALLCKINISRNQLPVARKQLLAFEKKAKDSQAFRLMPNMEALENWFDLLEGNVTGPSQWMEKQKTEEAADMNILRRYRYLMQVRTCLFFDKKEEAANLIERLSVYFKEYNRTYMNMENELLKAILQYRMQLGDYKKTLTNILPQIEDYHFVNLIAREGMAIRPLLKSLDTHPVSDTFWEEIMEAVDDMAVCYPNYLMVQKKLSEELTAMEQKILHLYCQGVAADLVCDLCQISYNTLKYHNKNIYRKLGVSGRADAERRARELFAEN